MLARKFSSLGRSLWPRAWRARKATLRPSSVPRMYASEGSPKGVCCWSSCASLKPGMWYRPLPPIMPISACCNCAPDGGWFSSLERQGGRGCGKEPLPPQPPQRLKPPLICDGCGAAKAAPFQSKTKVDYTRWGSWLCGRGLVLRFFLRPEIRFYLFCSLVVEAFADQNLIASDFNYYYSFIR